MISTGRIQELVGGWRQAPFYVLEPEVYRPDIAIWYDPYNDQILDMWPEGPDTAELGTRLGRLLDDFERRGLPLPRIRVQTVYEREEVVRAVGTRVEIVSDATDELDELMRLYAADHPAPPAEPPSYSAGGRISDALNRDFFDAMEDFLHSWPYQWSSEYQPFRIDFPGDGDNSYCVLPFEQDDHPEHVGFVLFNDIWDYLAVRDAAVREAGLPRERHDYTADVLRLSFEPADRVPEAMRREAARFGWSIASSLPVVRHQDADGLVAPLSPGHVVIVVVCASLLIEYFGRHRDQLENLLNVPDVVIVPSEPGDVILRFPYDERPGRVKSPQPKSSGPGLRLALVQEPPKSPPPPSRKRKKKKPQ